jgi:sarcosine oxidase subunit gamma
MSEAIRRESPLVSFGLAERANRGAAAGAGVVASERALLGHFNLRGDPADPRFVAGVSEALGAALPVAANTVADGQGNVVYWLGPDEWLVVTAGDRAAAVGVALRTALSGVRSAVTEVSGGQTVVVLRGASVRDALAKGCPLDLDPRVFRVGACAQSHLAKAPILIRPLADGPAFEIVVRRSFADYFWTWLEDAAAEYGFAIE